MATETQHCPDPGCPGVIEPGGECSHCGDHYKTREHEVEDPATD